jgi:hypothetical protein
MTTIYKSPLLGCCLVFLFLVATAANGANDNRFRTWVLPSGVKIEAQFQRIKGNNVILLTRAGKEQTIGLFALSAGDKAYVRLTSRGTEPDDDLDESAKATPFVIDFSKGETKYRHTVKYPLKVDMQKTVVEFTISGNGTRLFPSSTRQKSPFNLGQSINYVIRLAPAPTNKAASDLAADVRAKIQYDSGKNEFVLYVEPSVKLIRGRAGAAEIPLSVGECNRRVAEMEKTTEWLKRQNADVLPRQIKDLIDSRPQSENESLIRSKNLKTLQNAYQSNRNRIPTLQAKAAYLQEFAYALRNMESITVQYRIFLKVGGTLKLIVDGTN